MTNFTFANRATEEEKRDSQLDRRHRSLVHAFVAGVDSLEEEMENLEMKIENLRDRLYRSEVDDRQDAITSLCSARLDLAEMKQLLGFLKEEKELMDSEKE